MRKLLFIFILLISTSLFSQKGYWLCKSYKVIDSTKGWTKGDIGLIIDFSNSKLMHLTRDTTIQVNIDKINKKISKKTDSLLLLSYKKVNNTIEMKNDNVINVFSPFKFKKELNFSKEKVFKSLISGKAIPIKDSLKLFFLDSKSPYHPQLKIFKTKFKNNEAILGNWFINKINNNIFVGFNNNYDLNLHFYRVSKFKSDLITLEPIITYDFLLELKKIEFEK